jgi:hypothetical protein
VNASISVGLKDTAIVETMVLDHDRRYFLVLRSGDGVSLFLGDFDADSVKVARAIAAKLTAAADDLESKLSASAPPSAPAPPPAAEATSSLTDGAEAIAPPVLPAEFQPVEEVL